MIISLIGNDGSGKTTTLKLLIESLEKEGRGSVRIPGFNHLFLDHLKWLMERILKTNVKELHREYSSANQKKRRLFLIWPYLVYLDCLCLLLKYRLQKSKLIFFDRYPYDYLISFQELGVSSPMVEKLFKWIPKPDHIFLFDASPMVAYERKKHDHTGNLAYYTRQRERYLRLAKEIHIPVVNTDSDTAATTVEKLRALIGLNPAF